MLRTYSVVRVGRKFYTQVFMGGWLVGSWASKTKRRAHWKGSEFIANRR